MKTVIHMSPEEYTDLLKQKNSPDELLRDTNSTLTQKVADLTKQLESGSFKRINVDSPIMINDGVLSTTAVSDFVQMYNTLSHYNNCATVKSSDTAVFDYLEQMATMFACEPFFKTAGDVKKYRTSLQKKALYNNVKRNGLIHLLKVDS